MIEFDYRFNIQWVSFIHSFVFVFVILSQYIRSRQEITLFILFKMIENY